MMQGAIERSNVNSVSAMVALIDAHRRLEQSQKAIKTIDELNGKIECKSKEGEGAIFYITFPIKD
jgi:flagellar basal body rod protein FlgG